MSLGKVLDKAKYVRFDEKYNFLIAWFGADRFFVYTDTGFMAASWQTTSNADTPLETIDAEIQHYIDTGWYPHSEPEPLK